MSDLTPERVKAIENMLDEVIRKVTPLQVSSNPVDLVRVSDIVLVGVKKFRLPLGPFLDALDTRVDQILIRELGFSAEEVNHMSDKTAFENLFNFFELGADND